MTFGLFHGFYCHRDCCCEHSHTDTHTSWCTYAYIYKGCIGREYLRIEFLGHRVFIFSTLVDNAKPYSKEDELTAATCFNLEKFHKLYLVKQVRPKILYTIGFHLYKNN